MQLALVGKNIQASMMPTFFATVAQLLGTSESYVLREIPNEFNDDVESLLDQCSADGIVGVNITYPFKERAFDQCWIDDPMLNALGAVNTVIFDDQAPVHSRRGYNTDYTGLIGAWRSSCADSLPGVVAIIGNGGVGRAAAFAMAARGATELRLFDEALEQSESLSNSLKSIYPELSVVIAGSASQALDTSTGLMNCTPIGMYFSPGLPVNPKDLDEVEWIFDAVYSPLETELIVEATARNIHVISGFELFLGQAIDAHELFTGRRLTDEEQIKVSEILWRFVRER